MINKYAFYLVILLAAVFSFSCSGAKENTVELKQIPVKEIKDRVNKKFNLIESLEASGSISFDSPDESGSGSIDVKIKKPDTVYVNIEGPFGISVASALITRNNFSYYNAQENVAITGPTTENNINAILRIKVSFDELINSFAGSFYFTEDASDSIDAVSEENTYVLQTQSNAMKQRYMIEPVDYTINTYKVTDKGGNSLLEVNYLKFSKEFISGTMIDFPNQIEIKKPDKKQTVWIYYDTKTINKRNMHFKMKIPKSAKQVKWE